MGERTVCYAGVGVSRPSEDRIVPETTELQKSALLNPRKSSWNPETNTTHLHRLSMPAMQNNRSYCDHPERVKVTVSLCHYVTVQGGPHSPGTVRSSEKVAVR